MSSDTDLGNLVVDNLVEDIAEHTVTDMQVEGIDLDSPLVDTVPSLVELHKQVAASSLVADTQVVDTLVVASQRVVGRLAVGQLVVGTRLVPELRQRQQLERLDLELDRGQNRAP